ncbi:transcription antitermination factor NusB [Tessaracoccus antarcticus]|uniref:Transcription antitermination protein NusB n=1 Tax=Tessaracoccus antarcticus TaxID=2479848 RepID=A0A3M0GN72_9ACTN|nr:transcription antitermination factor NusB [Tessaracoccus antarcticus]RMB58736.1 transcription antitermination factor NusB [Tessaracoccus antarcticus]
MPEPTPHYGAQTKARKGALDILYAAELRRVAPVEVLMEVRSQGETTLRDLTVALVHGIAADQREIDARIIACVSGGWTLDRMPALDRNIARIAVYEIDHTDTPPSAVIAEALKLAGDLSTDDSPAFLNGLLSRVLATKPPTH